jgi:iron uptake system component EfeO
MHDSLLGDLDALVQAAKDMQAAAPASAGRGWDKTLDAPAIAATKDAWIRARSAYERIEGALAPIFPDIDASIDARYDDFLSTTPDDYLFDDKGVTGLHAAERILYADTTPPYVVTFEKSLPGYKAAASPATEQEAADFKNKLLARIITDAQTLRDEWQPAKIDVAVAFQGLISLMNEQREKVNKASTDEEESRYAQRTMADLRDNLAGTKKVYAIFQPWILAKAKAPDPATEAGPQVDGAILAGLAKLDALYGQVSGAAIPQPPASWSSESPSVADLATPFGALYSGVRAAVDPVDKGSIVGEMNAAAVLLGFPRFVEGK